MGKRTRALAAELEDVTRERDAARTALLAVTSRLLAVERENAVLAIENNILAADVRRDHDVIHALRNAPAPAPRVLGVLN